MFRGKKYQESAKLIDKTLSMKPLRAWTSSARTAKAKFDETVEAPREAGR